MIRPGMGPRVHLAADGYAACGRQVERDGRTLFHWTDEPDEATCPKCLRAR